MSGEHRELTTASTVAKVALQCNNRRLPRIHRGAGIPHFGTPTSFILGAERGQHESHPAPIVSGARIGGFTRLPHLSAQR